MDCPHHNISPPDVERITWIKSPVENTIILSIYDVFHRLNFTYLDQNVVTFLGVDLQDTSGGWFKSANLCGFVWREHSRLDRLLNHLYGDSNCAHIVQHALFRCHILRFIDTSIREAHRDELHNLQYIKQTVVPGSVEGRKDELEVFLNYAELKPFGSLIPQVLDMRPSKHDCQSKLCNCLLLELHIKNVLLEQDMLGLMSQQARLSQTPELKLQQLHQQHLDFMQKIKNDTYMREIHYAQDLLKLERLNRKRLAEALEEQNNSRRKFRKITKDKEFVGNGEEHSNSCASSDIIRDTAENQENKAELSCQLGSQAQPFEISSSSEKSEIDNEPRRSGRVRRATRVVRSQLSQIEHRLIPAPGTRLEP
jgi:hypothetical protein